MAGHSKFKNIQHRKGLQDKRRAGQFNRLGREITVATRAGLPDPAMNPRLRSAILAARAANMPKDRIDRAIKSGSVGGDGANYEEVRYEGYGPSGVAIIIEAMTDNRNRTASDIRAIFGKNGGNLGDINSVSFSFRRHGLIVYPSTIGNFEGVFDIAAELGAEDVTLEESEDEKALYHIITAQDDLMTVRAALEEKFGTPETCKFAWTPATTVSPDMESARVLLKLLDSLEENDDVQDVYSNIDLTDEQMESLG